MDSAAEIHSWLIDQSLAGVGAVAEGRVVFANARLHELLGYGPGELVGVTVEELVAERDQLDAAKGILEHSAAQAADIRGAFRARRKDGSGVPMEVHGKHGTFQGQPAAIGLFLDLTERKVLEARAHAADEKYRAIFENAVEGIYQSGVDGAILRANPALARIFGYASAAEMMAQPPSATQQLYVEPERWLEFHRTVDEKGAITGFESQMRRRDGTDQRDAGGEDPVGIGRRHRLRQLHIDRRQQHERGIGRVLLRLFQHRADRLDV